MSIILSDATTSITLHPDLYWSDELSWAPVEQTVERTVTGGLVVSVGERDKGRPITLEPIDDSSAWMRRSVVEQLRNWAAVAGKQMTLTMHGVARSVIFRHQDDSPMVATPIVHFSDIDAEDFYSVTLRFMEV